MGTVTTGAPGTQASVTNSGTATNAVLDFVIPQGSTGSTGSTGATGATGADGKAATVSVGTVTTGQPGTNASVTNSGTESAATLDFVIPQGNNGVSSYWSGVNSGVTLSPNQAVPLTQSVSSVGSGVTLSGSTVTLPAGTFLVSYSTNAESGGSGSGSGSVVTTLSPTVNGSAIPTAVAVAILERGDMSTLARTFLLNAAGGDKLQLVNATGNTYSTQYSNTNLVLLRLA